MDAVIDGADAEHGDDASGIDQRGQPALGDTAIQATGTSAAPATIALAANSVNPAPRAGRVEKVGDGVGENLGQVVVRVLGRTAGRESHRFEVVQNGSWVDRVIYRIGQGIAAND